MSLLFAAALLASATSTVPSCSWDKPGVHPFTGNLVESVDRYRDIPADVRAKLKQRMAARQYDELVTIRRDAIVGRQQYDPQIRDMHFGSGRVCKTVTRAQWGKNSQERGLVYCESGECLLVPTVCRNLSRVTRLKTDRATAGGPPLGPLGSAGGSGPSTFADGASPLGDGSVAGPARSRGLQVSDGTFGDAQTPAGGPGGASSYPTVQGLVGSISLVPEVFPQTPAPAVPEPAAAWLLLLGAAGLAGMHWRRRQQFIP